MVTSMRREMERLGWRVKYVPREIIGDYNACYRVQYGDQTVYPPAADKLGIPLGEVWLAEDLAEFEEYVLFHEYREIVHRSMGRSVEEAHLRARADEAVRFCHDEKWFEYFLKYPDYSVPLECLKELCIIIMNKKGIIEFLYEVLIKCARG